MESIRSKREYGTTYEMSNKNRYLPFELSFTHEQFTKLQNGIFPIEMGDRWFIFYEDSVLNLHWWSGQCICKIFLDEKKLKSKQILIVSDENIKPILSDEMEISELKSTIKYSLLGGEDFQITKI